MVGSHSRKIITANVTTKQCCICSLHEIRGIGPPRNGHPKHYTGSSKAMKVDKALSIYKNIYFDSQKKIAIQNIVSDDDSSTRELINHSCNHPKVKVET